MIVTLDCTYLEDLSKEEKAKHAYFLALAAILLDKGTTLPLEHVISDKI